MSTLDIPSRYEESDTPKAEWSTKRSFRFVDTEADDIEEKEDGNSEIRRNMRLETYEANSVRLILEEPSINVDYIMAYGADIIDDYRWRHPKREDEIKREDAASG